MPLIDRSDSVLIVVDVQERLAPALPEHEAAVANLGLLLRAADRLEVPVLATEHYPRGIGPTVAPLRAAMSPESIVEKIHFDATREPAFIERLDATGRTCAVVGGMEAHVCVLQTCLGLLGRGRRVVCVADACASRAEIDKRTALERLAAAGATIATAEMVAFEWLERGDTPAFRDLIGAIKRR
ncbi:MAG TPA: isochorismatase family protein [Geminicoccaceae bacterium]|nr:isochorismatase family protein [Geminicoccaceae bacterium]